MTDIFEKKELKPMSIHSSEPFSSDDYLYEVKLDGIRCIAYLDNNYTLLQSRNLNDITATYPELSDIHKLINGRAILDGELIALLNGKPDFTLLMKRTMTQSSFVLKLMQKSIPVYYVVFDILYYENRELLNVPLSLRKELLHKNLQESEHLKLSKFIYKNGAELFESIKAQGFEGVVAKNLNSLYTPAKRTRQWLKFKVNFNEELIVCGYEYAQKGKLILITGDYDDEGNLVSRGRVSVPNSLDVKVFEGFDLKRIQKPLKFPYSDTIIWLEPELKIKVRYQMLTENNSMREPVFLSFVL